MKYIAVLLCLIMLLSFFGCNNETIKDIDDHSSNHSSTTQDPSVELIPPTKSADYDSVLEVYRLIVEKFPIINQNPRALAYELGIRDKDEEETFVSLYSSIHLFYPGRGQEDGALPHYKLGCGYSVKDLNGDGVDELVLMNKDYYVMAIFSYSDGKLALLGNYWDRNFCWIDGDGLLHLNGSNGSDHTTNAVYRIADGGEKLDLIVEFGTNGHEWIDDVAYTKYYKVVSGQKVSITEGEWNEFAEQYGKYLGSVAGAEATKAYSGLPFISLYTEDEIAMEEMYEVVINDAGCVIDERLGEVKLKSLRFTSNDTRLDECKLLRKAMLDIDQDGVNEYVIQSPNNEYIILHYYNGKVYSYWLDTVDFYKLNTDGSFYWYDSLEAGAWKCGLNQIIFDGESLSISPVYSLQYSANAPKYEYFVEGQAVTEDEYHQCCWNLRKNGVDFSPFELTCSYPITAEQAWDLANAYWDYQDGIAECSAGTVVTARIVLIDTPNSDTNVYRFAFQWEWTSNGGGEADECMPPHHISSKDQILVNAFTGKITASTYDPNGKGVSVEEAIEIAKKRCDFIDFDKEGNKYFFEHDVSAQAPDHIYVIVIQKYYNNHYCFFARYWIDKNTGEVVSSYYLFGK